MLYGHHYTDFICGSLALGTVALGGQGGVKIVGAEGARINWDHLLVLYWGMAI